MTQNVIRKTHSVCPQCLQRLSADIVERDGKALMHKVCPSHGPFEVVLSTTPSYYAGLEGYYFALADERHEVPEYEFWPTYRCNMDCTICCFGRQNHEMTDNEATMAEIEALAKKNPKRFFIISGGEPTCREDLAEIISIFQKNGKTVTINTNGLKCADIDYVRKLQAAGLGRVNLQFDGFDRRSYLELRRQDCLDIKLKVIGNLEAAGIKTTFNATIVKGLNENAVKDLVDFAASHPFMNGVNFFTICFLGGARDWEKDAYIMPDEVIDILERQTDGKVARRNVYLFQKLHLAVKSFLKQKWCFYNQVYLMVRENGSYQPIDRFLALDKAEPWLDRYQHACKKRPVQAAACLIMAVVSLFLKRRSLAILKEIFLRGVSYFFKTGDYLKGSLFFSVSFSTGCDPYKFDAQIVRHCQNEIVAAKDRTGDVAILGSDGLYCMDLERRHRGKG